MFNNALLKPLMFNEIMYQGTAYALLERWSTVESRRLALLAVGKGNDLHAFLVRTIGQ